MATLIEYVELVARSHFSFLQGASHPRHLIQTARELGYHGLGLCDLNGFYGSIQGYQAYLDKPLFKSSRIQNQDSSLPSHPFSYLSGVELLLDSHSYLIYPKNLESYQRLSRFLSEQHQKKNLLKDPNLPFDESSFHFLDSYVLALPPWNLSQISNFKKLYSPYFYLALYRNQTRKSFLWQQEAFQLEQNQGYQLVACQRVLFAEPKTKEVYDLLTCIKNRLKLSEGVDHFLPNREHYLKPLSYLKVLWQDRVDLLGTSVKIAQDIHFKWSQISYHYPKAKTPPGERSIEHLRFLCLRQIPERLSQEAFQRHKAQFEKELSLIEDLKYEDYFLTLHEICQFSKQNGILHQGRGSAANSIVCYLLGLTAVHPDQIQMLFERFLSRERQEPPDIDIDFDSLRREEVIQFIFKRYGTLHAAQVANVICFRHKSALREVGLALGFKNEVIKKVQGLIEYQNLNSVGSLLPAIENLVSKETFKKWLHLANQLLETPRHIGLHSGGFVLTDIPLDHIVPIEKATHPGRYMIQWNKDDIETLSMMKIDVLGLGMLNALNKNFQLLKSHKDISLGLYQAPQNDPQTYHMIQQGQTIGVFQIESRAQMSMLPKLKPKNYYDLVMQIAMVRPGPIEGGLVGPFLKNRNLKIKPKYPMPGLAEVLNRTHGVPIFQEQIMKVMIIAANFSPGEADQMRRLLGQAYKESSQMHTLYQKVISRMRKNQIEDSFIRQILNTIKGFSAYGFPESHSASFAHLAYMSCYLKCHHPDIFVCSLLNSQPMGFYSPRTLIQEAKSKKVTFLPLNILKSDWEYTLEKQDSPHGLLAVRQGFLSLQGIQKQSITLLKEWRSKSQSRFSEKSQHREILKSLVFETTISHPQLTLIIQSQAFSFTGESVQTILWKAKSYIADRNKPLSQMISEIQTQYQNPNLPKVSELKSISNEYQNFGYSLIKHPIEWLREKNSNLKNSQLFTAHQLKTCHHNQIASTLGLLAVKQKPPTANGVCFLSLEDESGISNIILWPTVYEKYRIVLNQNCFFIITGVVQNKSGVVNLLAQHIWPVEA